MATTGCLLWVIDLTIGKPVNADPFKWPQWANVVYFGWTRSTFALGGFLIIFSLFFSPNTFIKEFLRRPFFRMAGSLCFMAALITPMAIDMILNSAPDGNMLTMYWVSYICAGNIIFIMFLSFVLYLLVQHPLQKLTGKLVQSRYLS